VSISRVAGTSEFPADFILIAALNPYRGSEDGTQDLARAMQETYKNKVSGPILDRIDLWIEVPHVPYETLTALPSKVDETGPARTQILNARAQQYTRHAGVSNSSLSARELEKHIFLSPEVKDLLKVSSQKLNLSPRSYHRLIKVARTIADLDDATDITTAHVLEALQYRVSM
jgi:magnesium chelatase family protein